MTSPAQTNADTLNSNTVKNSQSPITPIHTDGPNPLDGTRPAWTGHETEDFALVLEGGSMRGLFTAGVTDFFLDKGLCADLVVGTSAGALAGVNYVAGATGRTAYLNCKYCTNWHWLSMSNYVATGNVVGSMMFDQIGNSIEPFSFDALRKSPMQFVSVSSDLEKGDADYHCWKTYDKHEETYLKASSAMPFVSKLVHVDGKTLLDGGICDSVPYIFAQLAGYKKIVIVLTREDGYVKKPYRLMGLAHSRYRDYPLFIERMEHRYFEYNLAYRRIKRKAEAGEIFVIRPTEPVTVKTLENDPYKLFDLYKKGYRQAALNWNGLVDYLGL